MQLPSTTVCGNMDLMKLVHEFYGQHSYIYIGCLSKGTAQAWSSWTSSKTNSKTKSKTKSKTNPKKPPILAPKTAKHLVTMSRSRISELVREQKRKRDLGDDDGNLLITECMKTAGLKGYKRGVVRVRKYCARKQMRLCSQRQVNMMDAAARSGSLSLLRYLKREYFPLGKRTMVEAVHAPNSPAVVRWFLTNTKCKVPEEAKEEAAKLGNIGVLRVFNEFDSCRGFGFKVMELSGHSGSIETLDFLRGPGQGRLTPLMLGRAAMKGHLEFIKHVRGLGVAWDDRVCWMAAYYGHLHVLEWVRSQNPPCPWDGWTLRCAIHRKHHHVVQFCRDNHCPV